MCTLVCTLVVLPSWPCCIAIIDVFGPIGLNLWSTAEDWRAIRLISFLLSKCPVRFKAACTNAKPWSNYHFVSVQKTEKVTSSWWWKRITAACQHRLKTQANGLGSDATSRMWRRRFVLRQISCLFCQECEKNLWQEWTNDFPENRRVPLPRSVR